MLRQVEEIGELLARGGSKDYGGEAVSQLEHALQCAALAEAAGQGPELITACLLHDIGHLLDYPAQATARRSNRVDQRHEYRGWEYLRTIFGPAVTEPVRLHVEAKRYLCFANPGYWEQLSPVSKYTLELQGGVFLFEEAADFINQPYASEGVQLRQWDDQAKVPGQATPSLAHFQEIMVSCLTVNR